MRVADKLRRAIVGSLLLAFCSSCDDVNTKIRYLEIQPYLVAGSDWTGYASLYYSARDLQTDREFTIAGIAGFHFTWGERVVARVAISSPPPGTADAGSSFELLDELERGRVESGFEYRSCLPDCFVSVRADSTRVDIGAGGRTYEATVDVSLESLRALGELGPQAEGTFVLEWEDSQLRRRLTRLDLGDNGPTPCGFRCP